MLVSEPCPDLVVTLVDEDRRGQHGADLGEERMIGKEGLGATPRHNPRRSAGLRLVPRIPQDAVHCVLVSQIVVSEICAAALIQ